MISFRRRTQAPSVHVKVGVSDADLNAVAERVGRKLADAVAAPSGAQEPKPPATRTRVFLVSGRRHVDVDMAPWEFAKYFESALRNQRAIQLNDAGGEPDRGINPANVTSWVAIG